MERERQRARHDQQERAGKDKMSSFWRKLTAMCRLIADVEQASKDQHNMDADFGSSDSEDDRTRLEQVPMLLPLPLPSLLPLKQAQSDPMPSLCPVHIPRDIKSLCPRARSKPWTFSRRRPRLRAPPPHLIRSSIFECWVAVLNHN